MNKTALLASVGFCLILGPTLLVGQQKAQIAILDSSVNTSAYFGIHYAGCKADASHYLGSNEYQRYFRGWMHVLDNAQPRISYDIIYDSQLTEKYLSGYKLLILSNTSSISDESAKVIRQWVLRGGRLLATFGAGYKQILDTDPQWQWTPDTMKVQEGGTNGLHQLWKDPLSKMVSSYELACSTENFASGDKTCCLGGPGDSSCVAVNVLVTQYQGPTEHLQGLLLDNELAYAGLGNMLVQRPMTSGRVLAFFKFYDTDYSRPSPAIIVSDASKGRVVYFAFAPEFIISLNEGLPKQSDISPSISDADYAWCVGDFKGDWQGYVPNLTTLMKDTVLDLLNH